jgi:hypothetical protein
MDMDGKDQSIEDASRRDFEDSVWNIWQNDGSDKTNVCPREEQFIISDNGKYQNTVIEYFWLVWQASRQSSQGEPVGSCNLRTGETKIYNHRKLQNDYGLEKPTLELFLAAPQQAIPDETLAIIKELSGNYVLYTDSCGGDKCRYCEATYGNADNQLHWHKDSCPVAKANLLLSASPASPVESDK